MESKKIKKGDFIELEYTGKLKEDGSVFDTTKKEVAMASNLNKEADYRPIIVCVGEGHVLGALEKGLECKTIGKYDFNLEPEEAFGKKSAKLLKLIPMKVFKQQDIMPYMGLDVNVDGMYGIVRNVSGGRVIVDFNHPLSGREIIYEVEVLKFVTSDKEKLESVLQLLGVHYNSASVKEKNAMVVLEHEMSNEQKIMFEEKAKKLVGLKDIKYVTKKHDHKHDHDHNHEHTETISGKDTGVTESEDSGTQKQEVSVVPEDKSLSKKQ
ncbi:peptidylprolyl isomerase [archaeon]|nr:peptidylprolyl isomerase [archaeon]MBL7057163.1 peptidylprolyl isomerase [Candidatus Woesearchaeota archaeon]